MDVLDDLQLIPVVEERVASWLADPGQCPSSTAPKASRRVGKAFVILYSLRLIVLKNARFPWPIFPRKNCVIRPLNWSIYW